jgi:hypothetical protein
MPVTLPLYVVLDLRSPERYVEKAVAQILPTLVRRSPAARRRFVDDIEAELAAPRQLLRKVLREETYGDDPEREASLRRFLRRFAEALRSVIHREG